MNRHIAIFLAAFAVTPAWAVNKCTSPNGQIVFQDAPCQGVATGAEDATRRDRVAVQQQEQRKAKVDAEIEAWEAKKKATGFKTDEELLAEAQAKCGRDMQTYPTIGMTEYKFKNCTTWGLLVQPDTVNETKTTAGDTKQFVYPVGREIRYIYTRSGLVSAIQR